MGGMLWAWDFCGGSDWARAAPAAVVLGDPVSIWTTCLKEEVSAWTNVVGYGFADSDPVIGGLGDGSGDGGWLLSAPVVVLLLALLLLLLW
uniref:Uncharacterized protein n=1 Tax=Rhizophora mucronata TaxID=61149 RepID=A0A2P2P9B0_RHIMU